MSKRTRGCETGEGCTHPQTKEQKVFVVVIGKKQSCIHKYRHSLSMMGFTSSYMKVMTKEQWEKVKNYPVFSKVITMVKETEE